MINCLVKKSREICLVYLLLMTFFACFIFPAKSLAADKSIFLIPSVTKLEADTTLEVKVYIDTNGEKVGAIGFDIEFPTELLEGAKPNVAGSVFPMSVKLSSTRVNIGVSGADGFSGKGLVTTLVFKAKQAGDVEINITNLMVNGSDIQMVEKVVNGQTKTVPEVPLLTGYIPNPVNVTVYGIGLIPIEEDLSAPKTDPNAEKIALTESSLSKIPQVVTPPKTIDAPGETKGSQSQVAGNTGATPEKPITAAPSAKDVMVKGFSFKNPIYYGLLPTFILLALVMNLGIKLYFTEKRRHLDLVQLFDTQLGTISSLESKLDLVDSKNEGGKERVIQEFEDVKNQLSAEEKTKLA